MSKDPNLLFFREEYTNEEIASRIRTKDFRTDGHQIVESVLDTAELSRDVILENRKSDFLSKIKSNVDSEEYRSFLKDMFEEFGEKGDRVNLQFYRVDGLSYQELVDKIETEQEPEPEPEAAADGGDFQYSSLISDYQTHEGTIVDIQFRLTDHPDDFELTDDGYVIDNDGERVDLSELDLDLNDYQRFVQTNEYTVEVRAYTDADLIAISNSKASSKLQKAIYQSVKRWGNASANNDGFCLQETELLLIQNLLDGENSGLDYSGFLDRNLKTAKYRGDRHETLSRSEVLTPARERGQITQVRFYHQYNDGINTRPVQVRVYHDAHISTSKPTRPDFVNDVKDHIVTALDNHAYLKPYDKVVDEFIDARSRDKLYDGEDAYRSNKRQAFSSLVDQYIADDTYDESESQVYEAVIANIGIELAQLDLDGSQYPAVSEASDRPQRETDLKEFFEDYCDYGLQSTLPDFEQLWNHLEHIINRQHQTPVDIIKITEQDYAL
ncbi:hypothetical protein [Haladaptatus halobius]|uniref:hypothetical protein n=1 Tax=Haladaptatus halobius TaxID=2884875 RepID=UPI001D0AB5CF|nr:hypothetical protein [Haladaptatus halobius]